MARFINKVKLAWLKGVEVIGTSASNLASSAKFKLAEINLETRRREVMAEFTQKAYDLWQKGTQLPEPLSAMLQEASELDERLSLLRAQRYAAVGGEAERPAEGQVSENGKENALSSEPADADLSQEGQPESMFAESAEEKTEPTSSAEGHPDQEP